MDYLWYYGGKHNRDNLNRIPKIGEFFTCVASEIYYDSHKLENVYNYDAEDSFVDKNAIRCVFVDHNGGVLSKNILDGYKGFIGNEYVLTDKNQYLPLYGIVFKRVEYLVIWRDYNFNPQNPNNYSIDIFNEIQEFHRKIKKIINRELNSKIYYTKTNEEALDLLNRKRYNKVVIITNGNNSGGDFIEKTREIIGANTIAAVTSYDVYNHIEWVQNMENVLILNGIDLHDKFFKCIKMNDMNLYLQLKEEINNQYNFNLNNCTGNLFNFPKFKANGYFSELIFD